MAIRDVNGYKFLDGLSSDYIVIESKRKNEYVSYIKKNKIKAVYVCSLYYFDLDIDFFKECAFVEKVNISTNIENFNGLAYLKMLKNLILDEPKGNVDLGNNLCIEELAMEYSKKVRGIEGLTKLSTLKLWKFKSKNNNLEELSKFTNLKELHITQSAITSLRGIDKLINLEKLELNYLSKLKCLDSLNEITNKLHLLRFDTCKKIKNHGAVSCLNNLRLLQFYNCGEISTISFINDLRNLEEFIFMRTNIVDGDLSPCIGLKYVAFDNKRHYTHKCDDCKQFSGNI